MAVEIVAELATSHHGDVDLACDMVAAAADAGAHTVKIQSYSLASLNPRDPQADWLKQSHLDEAAHERIIKACQQHKVQFLSTPFDFESLQMLKALGLRRFKIASTESENRWWLGGGQTMGELESLSFVVSRPWGDRPQHSRSFCTYITAIPMYPTPLECVGKALLLDGWSCHCVGTDACKYAIAHGVKIVEAHLWTARSRHMPWDKSPDEFAEIRRFADNVTTMTSGIAPHFRERWRA